MASDAAYYREYFKKNFEVHKKRKHKYYDASQAKILVSRAKKRAKQYGWEFDLAPEDITIPEYCPVLGIKLEIKRDGKSGGCRSSPSLDRINSSRGYTKDNVVVVSWRANHIKNNSSVEEMEAVVKFYKDLLREDCTN